MLGNTLRWTGVAATAALVVFACAADAGQVSEIWQYPVGDHIRCVHPIEDMDGDGFPDILVEIDHTGLASGHFKLLSGLDGDEVWGVSPPGGVSGGCGYGDMCVNVCPDLNGDGKQEALLGTAWGGRTAYAILADEGGATFWSYDTYNDDPPSGWVYALDWIPDVTGDGIPEIVFGCGSDNNNAYCIDGAAGTMVWKFQAPDAVESVATIGDVNGNGTYDVLVGTGDAYGDYTYCVDGGSTGIAGYMWRYLVNDTSYSVAGIKDVNDDGVPDALIGVWDMTNSVICVSGADGSHVWTHPVGDYVMRVMPIRDLNDDGEMDVLVASWDNAIICLDGRTGNELWNVPTGSTNGGDVWTIWPMEDVDSDGYDDVVAGSFDLNVYGVSGHTGDLLWNYPVGNRVYTVRGVTDLNGDGTGDAVAGTQYMSGGGTVFCLDADGDGTAVPPMGDVAAVIDDGVVLLQWSVHEEASLLGFHVYRQELEERASGDAFVESLVARGVTDTRSILAARAGENATGFSSGADVARADLARDGDSPAGFERLNDALLPVSEYRDSAVRPGARYAYMVAGVRADGAPVFAGPVEIVADIGEAALRLGAPSRNPTTQGATLAFVAVDERSCSAARASLYDVSGRLVRALPVTSEGVRGLVTWNGLGAGDRVLPSGVYFVRVTDGVSEAGRKVVLVR